MIKLLNTIYHRTIKIKPADGKSSTYVDFDKENNKVDLNFDVADHVRISKYKSIFPKSYVQKKVLLNQKYCTIDTCIRRP